MKYLCCAAFILVLINFNDVIAQNVPFKSPLNHPERCLTMQALDNRINSDTVYQKFYKTSYQIPKSDYRSQKQSSITPIMVPVAFHFAPNVVSCADVSCILNEVQDQLDVLNEVFGSNTGSSGEAACPSAYIDDNGNSVTSTGTGISFCYAVPPLGNVQGLDPLCDPPITLGAFSGGFALGASGAPGWDGILNVFITAGSCLGIADGLPGLANGDGVSVCARAFGGDSPSSGCGLDNDPKFGLGHTLVHEIGHYLGLFHTFERYCDDEPDNAGPFTVNDTPAVSQETLGCNTGCLGSGCGGLVPYANFMDYSDDACMALFTKDQAIVLNYWANRLFGNNSTQCSAANLTALTSLCTNNTCNTICPSSVWSTVYIEDDFCGSTGNIHFPNPFDYGLQLNNGSNDHKFTWSINGYLNNNGLMVNNPANSIAGLCSVNQISYYLNIQCNSNPLNSPLWGGVYIVNVFPDKPINLHSLVNITNENTCNEPIVSPVNGCASYVSITPNPTNVNFPVNYGSFGSTLYSIKFIPNATGPDCCSFTDTTGEIIVDGNFEMMPSKWTEIEQVPIDVANPNPYGIIGVSGNNSIYLSNDAWFGGWKQSSYTAIWQTVYIPDCKELSLTFDYKTFLCSNLNNTVLEVFIGNVKVATIYCESIGNLIGSFGPVNIKPLNPPSGNQTLKLEAIETGTSGGSILVDNLSLVSADCTQPIDCQQQIAASYSCADNTNCISNLNLTNTHQAAAIFQVDDYIESSSTVNANTQYKAGDRIQLKSGFKTNLPYSFSAYIENCN